MAPPSSSITVPLTKLATTKTLLSAITSIAATSLLIRRYWKKFLPPRLRSYILSRATHFFTTHFSNKFTLIIDQYNGIIKNEIYAAAVIYLGSKISPTNRCIRASKAEKETYLNVTMAAGEEFVDVYNGEEVQWVGVSQKNAKPDYFGSKSKISESSKVRSFVLTFHKKNKDMVINSYLPYIINEAKNKRQERRTVKIFSKSDEYRSDIMWDSVTFDHPSTFDTLAMDLDQKEMILSDLDCFVRRREHYRKIGKVWKRGYLLYGPPGTGKSSLIAAIANYLKFDVYDLELTSVGGNLQLRRMLLATANKSILVVEDIDCTIDLKKKLVADTPPGARPARNRNSITLSGLLNFVDGLWSSCGDERIIIFTTNHIKKLDPALLRPGRMDMHIHLSYCTPGGFELLASNYLGIADHFLFKEIEDLLPNAKVTPAEVAEQLLKNDDPGVSLQGLVDFIHNKIKENKKAKAKKAAKSAEECKEYGSHEKGDGSTSSLLPMQEVEG